MYYRYTNAGMPVNEMTGFGMFTKNECRVSTGYGEYRYRYDGYKGTKIEDMHERFTEAWEDYKECAPDYMQGLSAEEFFQSFNPEDIVEDAGAWDNDDFRRFFADYIYDGEEAIMTNDGAIVFDYGLPERF